jgi:hypothetical protein
MNKLNAADGLKLDTNPSKLEGVCEGCIFGKKNLSHFPRTGRRRATMVGQIIHSDTSFVPVKSPGGETCYVIFKDDYSSWTSLNLMKKNSEAKDQIRCFRQDYNRQRCDDTKDRQQQFQELAREFRCHPPNNHSIHTATKRSFRADE